MKFKFECLHSFSKNSQILNFMKTRPKGAELFHAGRKMDAGTDGQTRTDGRKDRNDEANSRSSQFRERV